MFERLAEARSALKEVVASLDPETLEGATATQLVDEFAAIERLAAAGKALCAKRVADSGAWDDEPSRRSPGATVHVVVDHGALTRGSLMDGETCEVPGIGPIPVATARALAEDAYLAALVTDGTDIKAVSHLGLSPLMPPRGWEGRSLQPSLPFSVTYALTIPFGSITYFLLAPLSKSW